MTIYGLEKITEFSGGLLFSHYGVLGVQLDPMTQTANILFGGWKDFSSRLQGKPAIPGILVRVTMSFQELGLNSSLANPITEISSNVMNYAVANIDEFQGAEIVTQVI